MLPTDDGVARCRPSRNSLLNSAIGLHDPPFFLHTAPSFHAFAGISRTQQASVIRIFDMRLGVGQTSMGLVVDVGKGCCAA